MDDLSHLDPLALQVMGLGDEARIGFLESDHWVQYRAAEEILHRLERLLNAPRVIRPPCFIVLGETQIGKTSLLKEFARRHPFIRGSGTYGVQTPVIYTIAPRRPEESMLEEAVLEGYDSRFHPKNALQRREILSRSIRNGGLQILCVDEIQQTFKGHSTRNLDVLEFFKDYSNRYGINVVVAGTPEAYLPVQTKAQIANRFKALMLPPWAPGAEVLQFIAGFERLLPLKQPSGLATREIAPYLVDWMEGMLGEMVDLLRSAATLAIRSGEERITLPLLQSLPDLRPSQRKQAAEKYVRTSGVVLPQDLQHA